MKLFLSKYARWALVLAMLLGLGTFASRPAVADAEGDSVPLAASNELIGTLPCFWVDDGFFWALYLLGPTSHTAHARMSTTLFVDEDKIDDLVLHADGHGFVFLNHTGAGNKVRLRFFGDVRLGLNRTMLHCGTAQFGVTVGSHFKGGQGLTTQMNGPQASSQQPFALPDTGSTIFAAMPALLSNQALAGTGTIFWSKSKWNTVGYVQLQELPKGIWVTQDMPGAF